MVAFYNPGDQKIYEDFQFVPQEKYRTGFTAPVQGGEQDASTPSFGIPNTNAFTNSGGNNYLITWIVKRYHYPLLPSGIISNLNVPSFQFCAAAVLEICKAIALALILTSCFV